MLKKLLDCIFPAKNNHHSESEAKIAALERELAELKALVKEQNQMPEVRTEVNDILPEKTSVQKFVPMVGQKNLCSQKAAYFDMTEYFCNGHDDTAVDVIQYDQNGMVLAKETFSWKSGCGEVTSEGIWAKADEYAQGLIEEGIQLRNRTAI